MKNTLARFACVLMLAAGMVAVTAVPANATAHFGGGHGGGGSENDCLSDDAISYTYDADTNSGVITVEGEDSRELSRSARTFTSAAPDSDTLCEPLYVTATSWKFTGTGVWPQARDVVNELAAITTVGEYAYGAPVNCGQGDIYASREPVPYPTAVLDGRNDPYAEHFLSELFDGTPTWTVQDASCITTPPTEETPPVAETPPAETPPAETPPTEQTPPTVPTPPTVTPPPTVTTPPTVQSPPTVQTPPTVTTPPTPTAPPTAPPVVTPPAATPPPGAALPSTGVDAGGAALLAAALLLLGGVLVATRSRLARVLTKK